jgi:hypothetical protein
MATSSRNLPVQPDTDDEILEKKPSHPETTALLIVCAVALILAIVLSLKQLSQYVNPETKALTNNFQKRAVAIEEDEAKELAQKYGLKTVGLEDTGAPEREGSSE